jgi:hypothetical protein
MSNSLNGAIPRGPGTLECGMFAFSAPGAKACAQLLRRSTDERPGQSRGGSITHG